jgi:hypothetical protein
MELSKIIVDWHEPPTSLFEVDGGMVGQAAMCEPAMGAVNRFPEWGIF